MLTHKNFFALFFLQWLILALVKIWFFNHVIFANPGTQEIFFWIVTALVAIVFTLRLGIINFLEAFFAIFVWVVGGLFLDLIITSKFTGLAIFSKVSYWIGYIVVGVAVLLFHKKRHIAVRHELHAKAQAQKHH